MSDGSENSNDSDKRAKTSEAGNRDKPVDGSEKSEKRAEDRMNKTFSQIWNFFDRNDRRNAECKECRWKGRVVDSSTSNLISHLKSTHGLSYVKFLEQDRLAEDTRRQNELAVQEALAEHELAGYMTTRGSARKRSRLMSAGIEDIVAEEIRPALR